MYLNMPFYYNTEIASVCKQQNGAVSSDKNCSKQHKNPVRYWKDNELLLMDNVVFI